MREVPQSCARHVLVRVVACGMHVMHELLLKMLPPQYVTCMIFYFSAGRENYFVLLRVCADDVSEVSPSTSSFSDTAASSGDFPGLCLVHIMPVNICRFSLRQWLLFGSW